MSITGDISPECAEAGAARVASETPELDETQAFLAPPSSWLLCAKSTSVARLIPRGPSPGPRELVATSRDTLETARSPDHGSLDHAVAEPFRLG